MSEDFSPKKAAGLWHKILNETPYTVGAVVSGGLVLLTAVALVTSTDSGSSFGGAGASAFTNAHDNTGARSTYLAKMKESSDNKTESVDSTRLLMPGGNMSVNMANSRLKGKTGESYNGGGGGTGARAAAGKDAAKTVESEFPAASKKSGDKRGKLEQVKRSLSGKSGGNSIFAGYEFFKGFGNKDGKKKEGGEGTTGPGGDAKRDKYGRQSASGHGKNSSRWNDSYSDASNGETGEGLTGMEGAFSNARQGGTETRGELLSDGGGGGDNVGTGADQFDAPGGGGDHGDEVTEEPPQEKKRQDSGLLSGAPADICDEGCVLLHDRGESYVNVAQCPRGFRQVVTNSPPIRATARALSPR